MDTIKTILTICSIIFGLSIFIYCASFIHAVWCRISWRKEPIPWKDFNPFLILRDSLNTGSNNDVLVSVIFLFIIAVGLVNIVLESSLASTKIGSFYEEPEYKEEYEAILYIDEKPIFCIATIDKRIDDRNPRYFISEIALPYGHSEYVDAEYDPEDDFAEICLGEWGWRYKLTLKDPATEDSYKMLENEVVSNYGEFCGSKGSDKFHLLDCQNVKNISPQNLIYFESEKEADALGYTMCSICADRY